MSKIQIRLTLIIILLLVCNFLNAQIQVVSSVWDALTNEPLPYCNITIKDKNEGAITNADGKFILNIKSLSDSIVISYLGYAKRVMAIKDVMEDAKIYLQPKGIELFAITITAESDFFYDIISKCRKNLQKSKSKHKAKVYYGLNTTRDGVPVEVLECYFNGDIKGITMDNFLLKNGKVGLKSKDSLVFLSYNLSQLVSIINLTDFRGYYPQLPFHLNRNQLKQRYLLNGMAVDNYYKISFTPQIINNKYFSGTAWIEKGTNNLLKLELSIEKAAVHPLIPREQISNLSLCLTYYFAAKEKDILLSHVDFKYSLDFEYFIQETTEDSLDVKYPTCSTSVNTTGLVYCYDYDNPFILPYFDYYKNMDDYQKLAVFPYNHLFWANSKLLLSEEQTSMLRSMNRDDLIFNADSVTYGRHFMRNLTQNEDYLFIGRSKHFFWHPNESVEVEEIKLSEDTLAFYIHFAPKALYKFRSQIFLDINTINDINYCTSYSVFNLYESYLRVPNDTLTRVFTKIYFDIVEIERRKMQEKLDANTYTIKQIEEIYYSTLNKIDETVNSYFGDVVLWTNIDKLKKWNQYVYENLGIDNLLEFRKNRRM